MEPSSQKSEANQQVKRYQISNIVSVLPPFVHDRIVRGIILLLSPALLSGCSDRQCICCPQSLYLCKAFPSPAVSLPDRLSFCLQAVPKVRSWRLWQRSQERCWRFPPLPKDIWISGLSLLWSPDINGRAVCPLQAALWQRQADTKRAAPPRQKQIWYDM